MESETGIRLVFFFGMLAIMAIWEVVTPRRRQQASKPKRWAANLGIVVLNTMLMRLLIPAGAMGAAAFAEAEGWGVLHMIGLPAPFAIVAAVVLLDCAIYWQHVIFHAVPVLWRLHKMHHADVEIDVSTGLRFHPIEILLSMLIKMVVIVLLGAPMLAVLIFEVLLNATAMFNHGNVRLPSGVDRWLRLIIVTPDMHRVHHSIIRQETDSNFGFNLSLWDRMFGSYRDQPEAGHTGMQIGLPEYRQARGLAWMLALPFRARG